MIQVSRLSKSYGARTLFDDVSFSMTRGERLGLVGRNGCGKSTLFKLILDEEHPDEGSIAFPRGYRVGHLAQHLEFHEPTVLAEACLGLPPDERDQEYRAEIILGGLGFQEADFHESPQAFSGGFQIRINLAKLLLSEPNLLLLDEPTNYLDILSMRWLTNELRSWKNELMIISHDRQFLDDVTTDTMLIHRGSIRKMPGGTEKLYSQVELDEEIYEKTRLNDEKKRKQLEVFINRFRAKASKATLVQSKMKALEKMGVREELVDEEVLDFVFTEAPFPGKLVAEIKDLSFHYPNGPQLIQSLSFSIGKNDRIAIVGKNGKGKSTLLRLLANELQPTQGEVKMSQNATLGYFGQTNIARLSPNLTVEQEISSVNPKLERTRIRGICGTMMFSGDDALKKISVLSGGERSRVLLGKMLARPTNVLLLDEPSNHLDMESIEAMIESLREYAGAVLIVTHSELILREVATRLIVFDGEHPTVFEHGYDVFLDKVGWGDEREMTRSRGAGKASKKVEAEAVAAPQAATSQKRPPTKDELKEARALEKKIEKVEEVIVRLETELKEIEGKLAETTDDIALLTALASKHRDLKTSIEQEFSSLETLSSELAQKRGSFLPE